jgi:6-phosphogluconolactonase
MNQVEINRFPDLEAMSWAMVNRFVEMAGVHDRFLVALSGGHTPQRFYLLVSTREDIDWARVHLFLGDDRYVPPDDPRSNELMIREALVQCIDIPIENVHWMYTNDGPEDTARLYEKVLHRYFEGDTTFDLAIQGIGDDGHTASIFPDTPEPEPWRLVIPTISPFDPPQRVSCTLNCLAASKEVIFMVSGESKAQILKEVLAGDPKYPSAVLAAHAKHVEWWVDEAALS